MNMKLMSEAAGSDTPAPEKAKAQMQILAAASLVGAVLASSCCIVPLVLLTIGIGGAWISNLTALAPYQPLFLLVTLGFLGTGLWRVYRKPKIVCEEGSYCASSISGRMVKAALWIAAVLVLAVLSINFLGLLFL